MAYPLTAKYKKEGPLCQLSFDDLNTIGNMLNGITIIMDPGRTTAEFAAPDQSGENWKLYLPAPPSVETAGKSKYMVYQITDDETDPPTAGWDWVRAHA